MEKSEKLQRFILSSIIPIACSFVVGMLFFPREMFMPHMAAFQFVVTGIAASLFYSLVISVESRWTYAALLIIFGIQLTIDRSLGVVLILRDVFYIGGMGLAVILYVNYFRERKSVLFQGVAFSGLYSLIVVAATEIDIFLIKLFGLHTRFLFETRSPYYLALPVFLAVLIGFALGVGIAIDEKFITPDSIQDIVPGGEDAAQS